MNTTNRCAFVGVNATALALFLTGCVSNHLSQFYVDTTGGAPVPKEFKKVRPQAYFSQNIKADVEKLLNDGNDTVIGYSDYWTASPPTIRSLQEKAAQVGATTVVCQIHYRETVTNYKPMYNWIPGTTATYNGSGYASSQGNATAYGNGWTGYGTSQANASYSATATASTPGHLEYAGAAPYNVRLYDVGAVFYRHSKPATAHPTQPAE